MSEFDTRRGPHAVDGGDSKVQGREPDVIAPSTMADSGRGWQLHDPMRIVRAERANAAAQIGRSVRAWRKASDPSAKPPLIFRSPKKGDNGKSGGEDKKDGTPGNNRAQNRQFMDAVREIERQIGRKINDNEWGRLHQEVTGQNMGFHEIVEHGVAMFKKHEDGK